VHTYCTAQSKMWQRVVSVFVSHMHCSCMQQGYDLLFDLWLLGLCVHTHSIYHLLECCYRQELQGMTDLSLLSCNSVGFKGPPGFQKHDSFLLGVRLVFPQAAESPLIYTAHEPKQHLPSSPDQASLGRQTLASGRQQANITKIKCVRRRHWVQRCE